MRTVGTVIDRNHTAILDLWTKEVRRAAFAEGLTPPELASMMPEYLSLLGRGAATASAELSHEQQQLIERHLSNRLRQGSVLNEILTEFAVLGRSVSRCLDAEDDVERPSIACVARLFAELSLTCAAVTKIFSEHMLEDEQTEKRYARLLHDIGSESIARGHAMPLATQMHEALAMIMKAMNAQAAALRLFNTQSDRPIVSAATGEAAEAMEQHARSVEMSAMESSQPAVVTASLRAAGIRAVLDVGLTLHHLLRGTLHVGIREEREFTASEIRRLQGLGDALIIHLDNVRLNASLREHADAIAAESEMRERFVSVLMHDLTGPLLSAKAGARKLLEDHVSGAEGIAVKIAENLARMEEMMRGLLDAHHIRAGHRLPMTIEECDVGALARSVIEELRPVYGDRFLQSGEGHVLGMWSADQLRRAIWNLITNAAEHGAAGRAITISVARRDDAAELSVHNEGPAISHEDQTQLVKPFSLPRSGRGTPRGWGLGLTLVWGCVEAHGGRLEVESEPGKGTTFKLTLPFDARPYADPG